MQVLVTRPQTDAETFAADLRAEGHQPLIDPVIAIENQPVSESELTSALSGIQALVFTSANGLRAFASASDRRDLRVMCVGNATADTACQAGFTDIETAGGDVISLAAMVRRTCDPVKGPLLHLAGSDRAGDLSKLLGRDGFQVRRLVLYRAVESGRLADETVAGLKNSEIGAVTLFSPRSARIFMALAANAGLTGKLAEATAVCLSQAVADAAAGPWKTVLVTQSQHSSSMVEMIRVLALEPRA